MEYKQVCKKGVSSLCNQINTAAFSLVFHDLHCTYPWNVTSFCPKSRHEVVFQKEFDNNIICTGTNCVNLERYTPFMSVRVYMTRIIHHVYLVKLDETMLFICMNTELKLVVH